MLITGDSIQDEPDGRYEGRETFIAVGCHSSKVSVYNVLGLLVYEVNMDAPVFALEWVGDMTGPSVLPSCKRSLSTCIEQEESLSALILNSRRYESSSSEDPEESGTVKKNVVSAKRSGARSPIRFDGGKDLFSPDTKGPHSQFDAAPEPARRRSFLRPRIVTETFKVPSLASAPRRPIPAILKATNVSSIQEALTKTDSRHVFDVFFSDALRKTRSASRSASSVYSQPSDSSEIWTTPPTNQKPTGRSNPVGYRCPSGPQAQEQTLRPEIRSQNSPPSPNFSRPLRHVVSEKRSSPPSRKVSFANFDFRPSDGQDYSKCEIRKKGLEERNPFSPPPPGWQGDRKFSFEVGLHEQEKKCEREFHAQGKGQMEAGSEIAWMNKQNANGDRKMKNRKGASVGMSVDECELRLEHRKLRQEMAMLREEFRALREVLREVRR